jgi:hypothetical protein
MKSAVSHLNQRNRNGQLVRCTGPRKEVSGGKRRIGGGYAQNWQIANKADFRDWAEQPIQRAAFGARCRPCDEGRLAAFGVRCSPCGEGRLAALGARYSPCGEGRLAQLGADSVAGLRDFHGSRWHKRQRRVRLARGGKAAVERLRVAERLTQTVTDLAVLRVAEPRMVTVTPR